MAIDLNGVIENNGLARGIIDLVHDGGVDEGRPVPNQAAAARMDVPEHVNLGLHPLNRLDELLAAEMSTFGATLATEAKSSRR